MIIVENTDNLAGVSIIGDFNDLYSLVEALHTVAIDEFSDKNRNFLSISNRVLGFCYDIRHSFQGDRELTLVDNGINEEIMRYHSQIFPNTNLYYKCNYFYPEMFFVMIALNELVKLRIKELIKPGYSYNEALNKKVVWDEAIAAIRSLQAAFAKCVKETITPAAFTRWLGYMNQDIWDIYLISGQYLDYLNIKYLELDRDKRLKKLTNYAKRVAEFNRDEDHIVISETVRKAAKKNNCPVEDIYLTEIDYPEEIDW